MRCYFIDQSQIENANIWPFRLKLPFFEFYLAKSQNYERPTGNESAAVLLLKINKILNNIRFFPECLVLNCNSTSTIVNFVFNLT
jgi:hypothetical protein